MTRKAEAFMGKKKVKIAGEMLSDEGGYVVVTPS